MIARGFLVVSLLSLAIGCKQPTFVPQETADQIVIYKARHEMLLLKHGNKLRLYSVAIGRGSGQVKQRSGEHETPEGTYTIDGKNAHSHFYRALHISYPNANDMQRAKAAGDDPGGLIMIHGIRNGLGWLGRAQSLLNWTDGCIAVSDEEMDEIWKMVPLGTPVTILH